MSNDDRSDRDVHPCRRWGACAAGLSAAVGTALAAAMIPAAPAFADPTDDAVPAITAPYEETILNDEITTLFGGINDPDAGALDVQVTDSLLGLLPGGGHGTDATEVETLLVNGLYTPVLDALGALDGAAPGAVPAGGMNPSPDGILNQDIIVLFDDLQVPSLAGPDTEVTDSLLGLLPGGVTGTDGVEVETLLANDLYNPAIDLLETLLGGVRENVAAAADAVPATGVMRSPDGVLNEDITVLFRDLQDPSLAGPDIEVTNSLLSLLPGGVTGTDGVEVETLLANDLYTPAIDLLETLLGGGMTMAF
jgi:hypothetical protein